MYSCTYTCTFHTLTTFHYLNTILLIIKLFSDDFEITIQHILNKDGKISLRSQISDLILLMSKVDYARPLDHKALTLYVLLHNIDLNSSSNCLSYFSELGGLRVLKNWIEECIKENDDVELLRSIIAVCSKIPWNKDTYEYVKQSEIGKWLKKASKYNSPEKDCVSLHAESKAVMDLWKEKMEGFNKVPYVPETVVQLDATSGKMILLNEEDLSLALYLVSLLFLSLCVCVLF